MKLSVEGKIKRLIRTKGEVFHEETFKCSTNEEREEFYFLQLKQEEK